MNTHSDRVWDMMESIDYCMLVVCHEDGLASRPMSSIPRRSEDRSISSRTPMPNSCTC